VTYLIDGYNLLFAHLGTPPKRALSKALERARRRLLDKVRSGHEGDPTQVTIIFDAAHTPPGAPSELEYHGLHVTFAVHEQRADDLIERLIRTDSAPQRLIVVTDDRHIQRAARRRHCTVMGCTKYLNWLEQPDKKRSRHAQPGPSKPASPSADETKHWLDEFADLESDPDMKALTDLYGFGADVALPED
jgi:predicted RNA-binding protein with PIN domain